MKNSFEESLRISWNSFLAKAIKLILIICVILLVLHAAGLSGIAGAIMATAGASAIVLTLETRGRLMQNVKATLEESGFNLPANIMELKFYDASKSFAVRSVTDSSASN